MTDDLLEFGLGGIPSPPDERDWPVSALYALAGVDAVTALPSTYVAPSPYPPVLNQGKTPQCVAYSAAGEQGYYDLRDQGPFTYDEATFFRAIGGTVDGAVIRDAFAYRLATGYPALGSPASSHRIASYYRVPVDRADLCAAILAFGPIVVGTPWYNSWFHPVGGTLPAPDSVAGGHAILADGWDATRGLRLRNSWGSTWGLSGEVFLPWAYLGQLREGWKAVDRIETPPTATYSIHVAAGATVMAATLSGACISGWTTRKWGAVASSAPCRAPVIKRGCSRGQATVVYVTRGTFAGKWIRIGTGVTLVRNT